MSETSTQVTVAEQSTQAATNGKLDVLDHLMKPEVQESLTTLVESLPKLTELVSILTKSYDLAQNVMADRVLIDDMKAGVQEVVKPIEEKVKGCASAAIEANDRAQAGGETIGLFGLLRMLKDPEMQKMFRFAQAYLDIMSERKKQH